MAKGTWRWCPAANHDRDTAEKRAGEMEIRKLNTLRGLAALIVVVSHYSNMSNLLNGALGKGAGQFGVMIFFILSGFLMSYLYMGKPFARYTVYGYAVARVARVVPLFLVVVLTSFVLQEIGVTDVFFTIATSESLISHLLLLSGTSVLWTIPAEIQFYGLFLLLWWFWGKRGVELFLLISMTVVGLIFAEFPRIKGSSHDIPYDIALLPALSYFLVGVTFGQLYRCWKAPSALRSSAYLLSLLLIPLLFPVIFMSLTGHQHGMWQDVGVLYVVSFVFFCITFLVPDNALLIANPVGDFLGKISYSLYLLHMPVLNLLKTHVTASPVLLLPFFLSLAIIVSYLSFRVIEGPARRAIKCLAYRHANVNAG
jgi:peptidoglycan/LPS O-acetylase OafA/YrhL